eukprot:299678-Rhodomonas_salina.3
MQMQIQPLPSPPSVSHSAGVLLNSNLIVASAAAWPGSGPVLGSKFNVRTLAPGHVPDHDASGPPTQAGQARTLSGFKLLKLCQ